MNLDAMQRLHILLSLPQRRWGLKVDRGYLGVPSSASDGGIIHSIRNVCGVQSAPGPVKTPE